MASSGLQLNESPTDALVNSPPTHIPIVESPPESPYEEWLGLDELSEGENEFFQETNSPPQEEEPIQQVHQPTAFNLIRRPRYEMTKVERDEAMIYLLSKSVNGFVEAKYKQVVVDKYGTLVQNVQRLWKNGKATNFEDYQCHRVGNCGRRRVQIDIDAFEALPVTGRQTIRQSAHAMGVAKITLHRRLDHGDIRRHTNAIKPLLTPSNTTWRMRHCLTAVDPASLLDKPRFQNMYNTIHIDEKWFNMSKKGRNFYLGRHETEPVRCSKSSKYIPKIMFLAAVARPRYDSNDNCTFDGKIDMFPFTKKVAAVRNNQNRPRSTLETKSIENINPDVNLHFLITRVLPAIAARWPVGCLMEPIFIQQDNCPSHVLIHDTRFRAAVQEYGLDISLVYQPPNSPDLNVLDLGFFRVIQSLQEKIRTNTVDQLIQAVEQAFSEFDHIQCDNVFLTLRNVYGRDTEVGWWQRLQDSAHREGCSA